MDVRAAEWRLMGHSKVCDKQEEESSHTSLHHPLSTSTDSSYFRLCADFPHALIIYCSCCVVFATFYIQLYHIKMYM